MCSICEEKYDVEEDIISCPRCKAPLIFEYVLDEYNENFTDREVKSIWRYNILPKEKEIISLGEGNTYLHKSKYLREELGYEGELFFKDESTNPTGSFVDRGIAVAVSHAANKNYHVVATVSPGNIGASLAAYASKAGLNSLIYTPLNIESGKLYQILMYNGQIYPVQDIERGIEEALGRADRDTYLILPNNPYYLEGIKTIAYEISEDLNWDTPDLVIVPMGNGGLIFSVWKGFLELKKLGFIDRLPKMVGVQFKGASPIVDRLTGEVSEEMSVIAPELSIPNPLNMNLALTAIKDSGGYGIRVEYQDAVNALRLLAEKEGLFVELAAASTISAVKYVLDYTMSNKIVCVLTGHGLKDPATIRELTRSIRKRLGLDAGERRVIGRTKIEILRAIKDGNSYGYAIWKYLGKRGVSIKLPTIYQHLSELERMGLIKTISKSGLKRQTTIYGLTTRGSDALRYLG